MLQVEVAVVGSQIRQVKVYWADTAPLKGANFNTDNDIMLQTTPNIPMEKKP